MSVHCVIKSDIETFIKLFSESNTLRFETFAEIWKSKKFCFIYAGRQNAHECLEFAEECMNVLVDFCFAPCQQQVRVCALYLIYGLFFNYPFQPRVKLRLTQQEWKEMLAFIIEMNANSHLDVEFVFNKLRNEQAFCFVATRQAASLLCKNMGEGIPEMDQNRLFILANQISAPAQIFQSDVIDELAALQEEYKNLKKDCLNNQGGYDASFNMIDENLVQNITKLVANHSDWRKVKAGIKHSNRRRRDSGQATSDSELDSEHESGRPATPEGKATSLTINTNDENHGAIRSEIKKRAITNVSKGRPRKSPKPS